MTEQRETQTLAEPNADYWRGMDGALYEEMIREREGKANHGYQQQEVFLSDLVRALHKKLGRRVRVLEFGCGFGRHARYLSEIEGIDYSGYDFSEKMLGPLRERPPASMQPVSERLFVGPDLDAALAGARFDLVFTVSVLIHNLPDRVPALLATMARALAEGGSICLVENKLVPLSVFENEWHQGCWLQSYPQHIKADFDVEIAQGVVDTHDIYLLKPNGGAPARFYRYPRRPGDEPLAQAELDQMSFGKLVAWARSRPLYPAKANTQETQLAEAQELLRAERERSQRRRAFASLADELVALRRAAVPAPAAGGGRSEQAVKTKALLWDGPNDTRWAQRDVRFTRVLHVFHQEWHGIRASAGYTPGHKLAIPSTRLLTAQEHAEVLRGIDERLVTSVVFHGYSKSADELLIMLRKARGKSLFLSVAWLGNTAQFHLDFEFDIFNVLLQRRVDGVLDDLACVKADMHLISGNIFPKTLLSMPPLVDGPFEVRSALTGIAFIPVPNDWRKNFYSNFLATRHVPRLREVIVTTDFRPFPGKSPLRIIQLPHPDRTQVFRIMRDADVVLNATLSECQPMTGLEGLALGTPCLTGPLALGELDAHPYQKLVQVAAVDSVREVRDAIDRVLDLRQGSARELREMMADYSRLLTRQALDRYCEFLRL